MDKTEKWIIISSLALMGLFVFSLLYAKDKYKSNVPECLPYDKAYTEPKVKPHRMADDLSEKAVILRGLRS